MTRTMKLWVAVGVAVLAIGLLAWWGHGKFVGQSSSMIRCRVAMLLPETGNIAFMGVPVRNGLELALAKKGDGLRKEGISIELLPTDSKGNAKDAVTAINQAFALGKADVVVTFLSGVTTAVSPIVVKQKSLLIGMTVDPTFLQDCPGTGIKVYYSYKRQSEAFADLCEKWKWKKVLVFHGTDQSSTYAIKTVFAPLMERAGNILETETYTLGQRDFKTAIAKHAKFDGQGIIIDAFGAEFPLIVSQIKATPTLAKLPILGSLGAIQVIPEQRAMMAGVKFLAPRFVIKDPDRLFTKLRDEYVAKYPNSEFTFPSVYAYDAFDLLALALRKAKSVDGRALFNALQGEAVPTTSDTYRFDPSGDYSPAMALGQFDDKGTMMFVEDVQ